MPATLTTVQAITKEIYGPKIVETLDDEVVLSKRIEKTSRGVSSEVGAKYVTFPLRVRRNHGIGYRNESEQLQAAGQQGYVSVRVPLRYGYGRVHVTGQTMDLVDENYNAFADALTREMEGLTDDLVKDVNRIMYGNGRGVLATLTSTPAGVNNFTVASTQYLELGQVIDIFDLVGNDVEDAGAGGGGVTITNIVGLTVTVSEVVTADGAGRVVVRHGNGDREPQGLASIVSNTAGLFQNLDGSVEPKWNSTVNANGGVGRPLSEGLMITLCDDIRRSGGGKPTAVFTDLGSRRAYFNLLSQQRRYNDPKKYDGGLVGLAFHYGAREIPVVEENDAPHGIMWFLNEGRFTIYRDKPWHWADRDGSIWKWVANFDAFEALTKQYWEFGVDQRNSHGKLADITSG